MSPIYIAVRRSLPKSYSQSSHHRHTLHRTFFVDATTTKWVRDRGLDHAVEREKNLRPLINIKNFIKSEPSKSLPISIIAQNRESLMIPTRSIEFIRKYPSIFEEFLPGGVAVHPHVRLTAQVLDLDTEEELMYQSESYKQDVADRLLKLLMLVRTNKLPLNVIDRLKWDLGLPHDFERTLVPEYPDYFNVVARKSSPSGSESLRDLELVYWKNEFASSVIQKKALAMEKKASARKKKAMSGDSASREENQIVFPMEFSRGFEVDKKFKKWIDEWQQLPYVSPYENAAHLSSKSDESDKWAVAVLHELLHILVPKKTDRENILCLGEHLGLRSRFKQALHNHPGIFYLSNKIGTYTVVLREGYKRGVIVEDHPLANMRSQYIHLMNTVKEDGKTISVPGKSTQENKKVIHAKGKDEEEEDDETEDQQEGELCDSSDDEVESDDVDDDSDEEDEDQSETTVEQNAINNRGRRGRKSNFDGKAPFRNAERGRLDGRRARKSDYDMKEPSRNAERGRSDGRRARNSDFDGTAPFRNAERGRSDGRRARKSDFDGTAPSRNAERGRSDGRRPRRSDFDVKEPSRNSERGRDGRQHPGKSGDGVYSETSRGTQTHLRHDIHQNARGRSNLSRSKGRSLPEKNTSS
ncbi:hypothetical protein ACFX19_002788 [Malus domestica]|uniref:PORR domain-containing protein n=1 Tax=Malus domestica TaxID=3750 RepID=A0A498IX11_MALDO|nr:hypothetical protein DVH24_037604 [Malus domestica]